MSGAVLGQDGRSASRPFAGTGPQGHRQRMRDRLFTHGSAALADYEILEMLLFLGIPRRDTKPLAKATINRFGTLAAVFSALPKDLRNAAGLDDRCASAIGLVREAARRLALAEIVERPVLNSWDRLIGHLEVGCDAAPRPAGCRVLFLDNRNRLLSDEAVGAGASPHLEARFPRDVAKLALERHATALIPVISRVGGTDVPEAAEVAAIRRLKRALAILSIVTHDALVLRGDDVLSLRREGLL